MKTKYDKPGLNDLPKAEPHEKLKGKRPKHKIARHNFKMPEHEYSMIAMLKKKLATAGIIVGKSDILRAGISELTKLKIQKINKKLSKLYLNIWLEFVNPVVNVFCIVSA